MDALRFDNVTLGYKRRAVLTNLSFAVEEGEFFGVIGGGRSGKTTLLRALIGILKPLRGGIVVLVRAGEAGTLLSEGGYINLTDTPGVMRFGYVPQRDSIDELFPLTVRDMVLMARYPEVGLRHQPSAHDHDLVKNKLAEIGLSEMADKPYRALSTDQKQRVLIARALMAEPRVMVLDEPGEGMNQENRRMILDLLMRRHAGKDTTTIYATRRPDELPGIARRGIFLKAGSGRVGRADTILQTS